MTVSPELAKIYASGGPDKFYLETLEFSHPNFSAPWLLTNHPEAFEGINEDGVPQMYQPYPIEISLPPSGQAGLQEIQIAISNVERTPVDELEAASDDPQQRISITYRAYASDDFSKPGMIYDDLSASEIVVTEDTIIASASAADLLNRIFPNQLYTTVLFPALQHV